MKLVTLRVRAQGMEIRTDMGYLHETHPGRGGNAGGLPCVQSTRFALLTRIAALEMTQAVRPSPSTASVL
jgi:hypothetical protein